MDPIVFPLGDGLPGGRNGPPPGRSNVFHAVIFKAQRTPTVVPCDVHGQQPGLLLPSEHPDERICQSCWYAVMVRVYPFADLMMDNLVRYYPNSRDTPPGWPTLRDHLIGAARLAPVRLAVPPPLTRIVGEPPVLFTPNAVGQLVAGRCWCGNDLAWEAADGRRGTCAVGHIITHRQRRGGI